MLAEVILNIAGMNFLWWGIVGGFGFTQRPHQVDKLLPILLLNIPTNISIKESSSDGCFNSTNSVGENKRAYTRLGETPVGIPDSVAYCSTDAEPEEGL